MSQLSKEYDILAEIHKELDQAVAKFSPMYSPHEGYAIILEELDELWEEVKKQYHVRSKPKMKKEAVQVAAMAMRFVLDLCEAPDEEKN